MEASSLTDAQRRAQEDFAEAAAGDEPTLAERLRGMAHAIAAQRSPDDGGMARLLTDALAFVEAHEPAPATGDVLVDYARSWKRKRDLDAALATTKGTLSDLEEPLREEFVQRGVEKVSIEGVTLSLGERLWARPARANPDATQADDDDYVRACAALEEAGWSEYVQTRFNVTSLSAAVSMALKEGDAGFARDDEGNVTTPFGEAVVAAFEPKINARKSSKA